MKVLILSFRYPLPETGGDYLRINSIARYLKSQGHQIIIYSLYNNNESSLDASNHLFDKVITQNRSTFISYLYTLISFFLFIPLQIGYFFSFKYLFRLKGILKTEKPDLIIAHTIRVSFFLVLLRCKTNCILEATDALSKTYHQFHSTFSFSKFNLKHFLYYVEFKRVWRYEKKMLSYFPKIVFVSKDDIVFLDSQNNKNVFCYPNGVSIPDSLPPAHIDNNKIVFLGNLRSLQNEDSVLFFANQILPLINKTIPSARFYVVGANPSEKILALQKANNNIVVTGFVPDLQAAISDAAVSVAPIRYGAGIQNKVLVAMAQHIPVVLSSTIVYGIPQLKDGFNCWIADTSESFANACIDCISNRSKASLIANNAYSLVKNYYSWSAALDGYERIVF